ncbi:MFS transporter [Plantactinospora soyae]|uniref:EmrB/QacA subfamily drug resistance transporter n=1 Tax=Plantactinospora soyae TaxID=1544732 RepID=A0A927MGT2_9ACTN|nr:MFS transporter [Plantactinospora soyae]MBE1492746.1 EmrB/QacA subfamily drug resistance transporter [Plantactinospora soyae]
MLSSDQPTRASSRPILVVLVLGVLAYALVQGLIAPVLPEIQRDLHTTQSLVTWVLTAYLLSASIFTPILGRLGDRIGKDRVMLISLSALAVGSLISAVAPNITVMLIGRVIQGAGGGVVPLAFGIIRDELPRERVAGSVGIVAALLAVGGGIGITLAGPITGTLGYRALFWLPGIVVVLAAVASHFVIPPSPTRHPGRISWTASILLAAWLVALLVPLTQASSWGWGSARVIGLILAAVVLAAAWIAVETRSTSPLIDMRMMRLPAVWTTNLVALLFGVGMYALMGFLPAFVETPASAGYGFGASITQAGLILLPMTAAMFLSGMLAPRLSHRFGPKRILVAGTVISIGAFAILTLAHDQRWEVLLAMAIIGLGFGAAFATMSNLIVAAVPAHQTGVANGMNANIRTIGGSLGAALMTSIVGAHTLPGGLPAESGYTWGFAALGVASIGAALAALLVPHHGRAATTPPEITLGAPDFRPAAATAG